MMSFETPVQEWPTGEKNAKAWVCTGEEYVCGPGMGGFAQDHVMDACGNLCNELLQSGRDVGLDSQWSVGQRELRAKERGAGHEGVGVDG